MTKSEMFKKAHEIARNTKEAAGCSDQSHRQRGSAMSKTIDDILSINPESWTDDDRKIIAGVTAPFITKNSSSMTFQEKCILSKLFTKYFEHSNSREKAIAYTVILGGVPSSQVGNITIKKINGIARKIESIEPSAIVSRVLRDVCLYTRYLLSLNGEPFETNLSQFNDAYLHALLDYIEERGIENGILFPLERRPKGTPKDVPMPGISVWAVNRILKKAACDLGFLNFKHIQYHFIARK